MLVTEAHEVGIEFVVNVTQFVVDFGVSVGTGSSAMFSGAMYSLFNRYLQSIFNGA